MFTFADAEPQDPERPIFHVMPRQGWINDPNAPVYHDGKYHLFFQHIPDGCEWDFGIVWGHVVSTDLVHWEHLSHALEPTMGGLDADGCFSGCAVVDTDGTPTILYTGVRLRSNPECGPLPPSDQDLNLPFIESQCIAVAKRTGDKYLQRWQKGREPFIALPPPPDSGDQCQLVGWRDPFVFEFKGQNGHEQWGMLLGSGRKTLGGAIMIYRSSSLASGWKFEGWLCEAANVDTGLMWECPLLAPLEFIRDAAPSVRRTMSSLRPINEALLAENHATSKPAERPHEGERLAVTSAHGAEDLRRRSREQGEASTSRAAAVSDALLTRRFSDLNLWPAADEARGAGAPGLPPRQSSSSQLSSSPADPGLRVKLHRSHAGSTTHVGFASEPNSPLSQAAPLGPSDGLASRPEPSSSKPGSPLSPSTSFHRPSPPSSPTAAAYQRRRSTSGQEQLYTHLLCISPDAPTNPVLYWLGNVSTEPTRFLLESAKGPLHLDLGDVLYAPNLMIDAHGRYLLWGWLQERRKVGSYDYAGCLGVPRILRLRGDRLIQEPAPEVANLRLPRSLRMSHVIVHPERSTPLEGVDDALAVDMTLQLDRHTAKAAGVLVRSWAASEGNAAILYDWEANRLEVVYEGNPGDAGQDREDLATSFSIQGEERRVGGPVDLRPGESLQMRILLDHSCVEVFLSTGEVLSTRIYRGEPPDAHEPGLAFVAFGGSARIHHLEVWQVATIWKPSRSLSRRGFTDDVEGEGKWDPLEALMPPLPQHHPVTVGGQ